jgi:hypothetical protein
LVQKGTHEELIKVNGQYKFLFALNWVRNTNYYISFLFNISFYNIVSLAITYLLIYSD